MWLKKLKKKKFQFILVALMLCFTSAIFSACISFVAETSCFTKTYTSYENCPKIISFHESKYDAEYFNRYDELMEQTDRICYEDITFLPGNFYFNGKQITTYNNFAFHLDDIDSFMHNLKMIDGEGKAPQYGEIWICSVCADSYGIKVGDVINACAEDGEAFRVSAIVATPVCPSPFMGTFPYYISESSAELLDGVTISGASFYSKSEISSDDYKKLLPEEFRVESYLLLDTASVELSISYLADIFGGVGLIAAAVIFVVSLIIIKFIIMSTLAKEYKEIGTYKALGFTENQIVGFYLKSFLFAGGIGIIAGSAASFPISQYLCNMVLRHLGEFTITSVSIKLALIAAVVLCVMLVAGVFISLRKIYKITPIEAFSTESISSKKKIGKSLIKNAYSPISVAVNDIARKKRASIMTIAVLTVSFYMSVLFSSVNFSLNRFGEMTGTWFAFPQYDAIITTGSDESENKKYEDYVKGSELVEKYVLANTDIGMTGMRTDTDIDTNNIYLEIYSDCSDEMLSIPLVDGRHPTSDDEILMSYNLAMRTGTKIGDWFHIENDTHSNDYLVTGYFSSMYNGGLNIIMDGAEYKRYDRPENYTYIMVFLKDGVSYVDLESALSGTLPYAAVSKTPPFLEGSLSSLKSVAEPLTTMFVIIFAVFSILNIVNLLIMNNIESRRQYGILKAMGFTNKYICTKNVLKIVLMTAFSACAALLMHIFLSQRIFFAIIHVCGLIDNAQLTAAITLGLFAAITAVALMFTIPLNKVAPTELMED